MPENIRSLVSCAFSKCGVFEMEGAVVVVDAWSVVVLLLRYGVYGFPFSYFNGSTKLHLCKKFEKHMEIETD